MEETVIYRKKLQDLVSRKIGYGVVQPGDNVNGGIPVIKVKDIVAGLPSLETLDCTTPKIESAYTRTRLHGGEIVLSIVGTIGKTCIVPPEFKGSNLVRATALIDITNSTISKWVKYYIDSPAGQNYIQGNLNTTVQPTLNIKTLAEMEIPFYQQEYMEKAVSMMSAIEEKIKLNNRINHNLEEQAQALYKSWFVDFEPFRDGKFVESELGLIPEGWRVGALGELNSFKRGKNLLSKDAVQGNIPVVAGGIEPSCYHNIANTHAPVITISASGANAGFMKMYHSDVWASDCSYIDSSSNYLLFTYCFLRSNERLLRHAQTGAVQPHVKPSDINDFKVAMAPEDIISDFQHIISSMFLEIKNRSSENSILASKRNTLLPRLMSGELTC